MAKYRFLNPYNFVRPLPDPAPGIEAAAKQRQQHEPGTADELQLLGRCEPPPHDRYLGLNGRITCVLEAKTPLFVSDSHRVTTEVVEGKTHRTYRFFQYDGKDAIPASSLRGMIRSVFEAVTNSCFAVFERDVDPPVKNQRFEHRLLSTPRLLTPARVNRLVNGGAELELFNCATMEPPVDCHDYPSTVRSGMIEAYLPKVVLAQPGGRMTPYTSTGVLPPSLKDGERVAALVSHTRRVHQSGRFQWFPVTKVVEAGHHATLKARAGETKVFGYLHKTGPNIENKHHERLFFRWDDTDPTPQRSYRPRLETVEPSVVAEYNRVLAGYWERHAERVKELDRTGRPLTELPFPSNFVKQDYALGEGDLVYYYADEDNVEHLCPVSMPRVPYLTPREDLLDSHLHQCSDIEHLCPACRAFGWVEGAHQAKRKISRDKITAYAGRLRFSHAKHVEPRNVMSPLTLSILSSPKPTTTRFYLRPADGEAPKNGITDEHAVGYDGDTVLRGRKVYRHHRVANPEEYLRPKSKDEHGAIIPQSNKDDQNRTLVEAHRSGSRFRFTIDFHNLAPVELGALLWTLELKEGGKPYYHRLGFAKPLGFGSVQVSIEKLDFLQPLQRYGALAENGGWTQELDQKEALVDQFRRAMAKVYGSPFASLANIKDLLALLGEPPRLPIHYPRPPLPLDYPGINGSNDPARSKPNPEGKNYEWFVGNKRTKGRNDSSDRPYTLPLAEDDTEGLPLVERTGRVWQP